jgi:hypothetical protein
MSARRPRTPPPARRRGAQLEAFAWWPKPLEYDRAPELAVLALLATALDIVGRTLMVAHPEIGDTDRPFWRPLPPTVPAAECVLRQLDRLQRALVAYRNAALIPPPDPPPPDPDDDMPF